MACRRVFTSWHFRETFFPGAMLAGLAAPAVWRARSEPGAKFLLAWVVPSWIVFELVPTKLPHYVLPLYPAIAILIAGVMDGHALSRNRWLIRGTVWWFLLMVVTAAALIGSQVVVGQRLGILTWIFAAAAIIFALFAWLLYRADGAETSLVRAATASIMLSWAAYGATIPVLRGLFPAVGLASYMHSTNCADPVAASVGFHEPSLVFLAGTGTILGTASGAADFLLGGTCRFAFVDSRQERTFAQRAEEIGLRYSLGPRIDGFAINGGQPVVIATFRSEPHHDGKCRGRCARVPRHGTARLHRNQHKRRARDVGAATAPAPRELRSCMAPVRRRGCAGDRGRGGFDGVARCLGVRMGIAAPDRVCRYGLPDHRSGSFGLDSGTDRRTGRPDNAPRFSGPRHHVAGSARDDGNADRVRVHRRRPARPRGHRRQAADRPGSSVHPRSVRLRAVVVAPGFCELSIRTYHDCLRGFGRLGHHFYPGTHRVCAYALLIAASRVVVSAHYPSDVIAGAALGTCGALWVRDCSPRAGLVSTSDPTAGCVDARAVMAAHQTGCRRPLGSLNNRDVPPREHPTGSRTFSCFP